MDTSRIGMVGAITSLVALPVAASAAVAREAAVAPAQSFSELLQPISNPVERLQISDAQERARAEGAELIQARWRHHHHAHYYRRGYYWGYSYARPYYWGRYYRHHHHHHHHHHHWR